MDTLVYYNFTSFLFLSQEILVFVFWGWNFYSNLLYYFMWTRWYIPEVIITAVRTLNPKCVFICRYHHLYPLLTFLSSRVEGLTKEPKSSKVQILARVSPAAYLSCWRSRELSRTLDQEPMDMFLYLLAIPPHDSSLQTSCTKGHDMPDNSLLLALYVCMYVQGWAKDWPQHRDL
jgi:hypothetical protein